MSERPVVIPGWLGWGNVRVGLEVYAGTSGDRFHADDPGGAPAGEGPVMARALGLLGRGCIAEGHGAFLVVVPERLIGNADAALAVAKLIADAVGGEVADP